MNRNTIDTLQDEPIFLKEVQDDQFAPAFFSTLFTKFEKLQALQ